MQSPKYLSVPKIKRLSTKTTPKAFNSLLSPLQGQQMRTSQQRARIELIILALGKWDDQKARYACFEAERYRRTWSKEMDLL